MVFDTPLKIGFQGKNMPNTINQTEAPGLLAALFPPQMDRRRTCERLACLDAAEADWFAA
jgi:hypothetical protein